MPKQGYNIEGKVHLWKDGVSSMTRNLQYVPYGYEPPIETHKGTMVYYDTFEQITARELELLPKRGCIIFYKAGAVSAT